MSLEVPQGVIPFTIRNLSVRREIVLDLPGSYFRYSVFLIVAYISLFVKGGTGRESNIDSKI